MDGRWAQRLGRNAWIPIRTLDVATDYGLIAGGGSLKEDAQLCRPSRPGKGRLARRDVSPCLLGEVIWFH